MHQVLALIPLCGNWDQVSEKKRIRHGRKEGIVLASVFLFPRITPNIDTTISVLTSNLKCT